MRVCLAVLLALLGTAATAQDQRRGGGSPGEFDFYVLALTWSPSYCATTERREAQCGEDAKAGFVVHGLWPQYDVGYPQFCAAKRRNIPRRLVDSMLDIMPSPRLVYAQWDKHGTCTGLAADDYFRLIRQASGAVRIPASFSGDDAPAQIGARALEQAFIAVNDGLSPDMIAVDCRDGRLQEVRICLGKDLGFTACPEVDRNACRSGNLAVPAGEASGGGL